MKKKLIAVFATAVLATAIAAGSASSAPGNGNNCVGAAVSESAHITQQLLGEGLGDFFHDNGLNPGQAIQNYHNTVCNV